MKVISNLRRSELILEDRNRAECRLFLLVDFGHCMMSFAYRMTIIIEHKEITTPNL